MTFCVGGVWTLSRGPNRMPRSQLFPGSWFRDSWIQDKPGQTYFYNKTKQNKTGHPLSMPSNCSYLELELNWIILCFLEGSENNTPSCCPYLCLLVAFCKHPPWIALLLPSHVRYPDLREDYRANVRGLGICLHSEPLVTCVVPSTWL